ncbi:MAG: ABC transporter permease subunit [Nocardioidaceae bacterium]|nr:ABC transporter permease subunit [Nocardioidaceae bacterium]
MILAEPRSTDPLPTQIWDYLSDGTNWTGPGGLANLIVNHLEQTGLALLVSALIALPLGLYIGHTNRFSFLAINIGNLARAFPTVGVLVLVLALTSIGLFPLVVSLVLLAVPPILSSTYAGMRAVDPAVRDAAQGVGMSQAETIRQVEIPMALPLILSGLRAGTLQIVATATIGAKAGLENLGTPMFDGQAIQDFGILGAGALLVTLLALALDSLYALLQRYAVSPGVTGRQSPESRQSKQERLVDRTPVRTSDLAQGIQ